MVCRAGYGDEASVTDDREQAGRYGPDGLEELVLGHKRGIDLKPGAKVIFKRLPAERAAVLAIAHGGAVLSAATQQFFAAPEAEDFPQEQSRLAAGLGAAARTMVSPREATRAEAARHTRKPGMHPEESCS